ncbi:MAG: metal ABC transporter substrate-binding protein [Clostridiales bacterium]|nr:metal ABC transporter substrate-binding protein [Clostridiales bacterium]
MKRAVSIFICLIVCLGVLTSCGTKTEKASDKVKVVTTIFPIYDWVRNIAGDNAEVTMLLDTGIDLHSFQPTAADLLKLSACDLFIYVGGESDEWAEDALAGAQSDKRVTINLMETLGESVKAEEIKPGMQAEEEEEEGEEGPEYDEHVWLSLKNASVICRAIADDLCKIDAKNKRVYNTNADEYIAKISELDGEYAEALNTDEAAKKPLIFGDRFPFRYLTDDYGLDYYAAFVGCSAETEASFETIVFLAKKVDEFGLRVVYQIEGSDGSIAKTIIRNTKTKDQMILTLNSMQSVTAKDVENGADYLETMRENLTTLKQSLL